VTVPAWARWPDPDRPAWTLGVEEEVMLLDAETLALAPAIEEVLGALPQRLRERVTSETHSSAVELATSVHASVDAATKELARLRSELSTALEGLGLRAASAGTHPTATWQDVAVSPAQRHREVEGAMRALARREPTFALHVHVGVPTPAAAIGAFNQLRAHLPLLLALSGNSPFWQGRDTGLASARTPLFQVLPARALLRDRLREPARRDVTVRSDEEAFVLGADDANVELDLEATQSAVERSRRGNPWSRTMRAFTGGTVDADLPPVLAYDEPAVGAFVKRVGDDLDHRPQDADIDPRDGKLKVIEDEQGVRTDREALLARITAASSAHGQTVSSTSPARRTPAPSATGRRTAASA
jgi:hypothetical protein